MQHDLFGSLEYNADDAAWNGYAPLVQIAALGGGAATNDATDDDDDAPPAGDDDGMDDLLRLIDAEMAKPDEDDAFADDGEDEEDGEEDRRRHAKALTDALRRREGLFPVNVDDPDRTGPTPPQIAAYRHLTTQQEDVARAVREALARAARQEGLPRAAGDEVRLFSVDITREHHNGIAYLVFDADCDWGDDEGFFVVYHRDKGADGTPADALYDAIESDEPVEDDEPLPGNHELLAAVLAHNEKKVRQLIAQGHDINALGDKPYPPLVLAVERRDVDLVKRLLSLGADPNLEDALKQTALKQAKRLLKEVTPRKGDRLTETATALARKADPAAFADYKAKLEEIVRLLVEAGAK